MTYRALLGRHAEQTQAAVYRMLVNVHTWTEFSNHNAPVCSCSFTSTTTHSSFTSTTTSSPSSISSSTATSPSSSPSSAVGSCPSECRSPASAKSSSLPEASHAETTPSSSTPATQNNLSTPRPYIAHTLRSNSSLSLLSFECMPRSCFSVNVSSFAMSLGAQGKYTRTILCRVRLLMSNIFTAYRSSSLPHCCAHPPCGRRRSDASQTALTLPALHRVRSAKSGQKL